VVSGDEYYIVLGADETISPTTLNYSGKKVGITLQGYGSERAITLSSNGSMFTVNSGVTLTLDENITIVGQSTNIANTASLVNVYNGNLIINNGAKINWNDNVADYSTGGGVNVSGGTFTMNGGKITDNTAKWGGGVYVSSGTFIMNGGEITDNTAYGSPTFFNSSSSSSGGGVSVGGTFTMNGGQISGNTANATAGAFYSSARSYGGGVYIGSGTFTISGGQISGNTASSSNSASITTSAGSYGGGVYVSSSTFIKSGSGIITGYASDTENGNTVKENNIIQNNKGHAVYVYSSGKCRETTAEPEVNLDSSKNGTAGGWE